MYLIEGNTGNWEVVIGLEVHAQIMSKSKLFSGSSTKYGAEANSQVSLVDAAMPGMLPVFNIFCAKQAIKTGLGLNAQINLFSQFDRKNYFYADLPQGYQISQLYHPIVSGGWVRIIDEDKNPKNIGITRIHLEQDAGKSMHDQSPDCSFIDLNRSGIALMEIVTEPDIRSPYEASEFIKKLRTILRYLETCDADMEKGNMRCDANVSVRRPGDEYGTRCEIKNLNSIKNIHKAIEFEAYRQINLIETGRKVDQETRLYDADKNETRTMRSKEDAFDYRYFPDPDLLPIILEQKYVDDIRDNLIELPDEKIERFTQEYGISTYDAEILCANKNIADFFDKLAHQNDAKLTANWIIAELFGRLNKAGISFEESKINFANFNDLLTLISQDVISGKIAKTVFDEMFATGDMASKIVEDKGLKQLSDDKEIEKVIDGILAKNKDKVVEYKSGKEKLFSFFVGQVMKATKGQANPKKLNEILTKKLK